METISITKKHTNGIVKELEVKKFFILDNRNTSRTDLFNFAMALGMREGERKLLDSKVGLFRTSYIEHSMFKYQSVLYDKVLSHNEKDIELITDTDKALSVCEEYANSGFDILGKYIKEYKEDSESFMYKILNDVRKMHNEYFAPKEKTYEEIYGVTYEDIDLDKAAED